MQEKQLLKFLNYPLFKITSEWQRIRFISDPYVAWSEIKGFTPVIDITHTLSMVRPRKTMIINQTSLGRLMFPIIYPDNGATMSTATWYDIRKVDDGKFAAIELRPSEIAAPNTDDDEDDE